MEYCLFDRNKEKTPPLLPPLSSNLSSTIITKIELPWGQVLIDGFIIQYCVTATLQLTLTGILLDNCHRGTQGSCNLTAEECRKYIITHAQKPIHTHAHTHEDNDKRVQTCTDTPRGKTHMDVHMRSLQKPLHRHSCTQ